MNARRANDAKDKVRELQTKLRLAAKESRTRRFHALYDKIWRLDVLYAAWQRVRANKGKAGVDRQTIAEVEAYGVGRLLLELQTLLREGKYRPQPVLRVMMPKGVGKPRPLGIPTVRDRIVQMAAKLVLGPVFEADFLPWLLSMRARSCSRRSPSRTWSLMRHARPTVSCAGSSCPAR